MVSRLRYLTNYRVRDLNAAIEHYLENDMSSKLVNDGSRPGGGTFNKAKAQAMFDKYKVQGSYLMEQD